MLIGEATSPLVAPGKRAVWERRRVVKQVIICLQDFRQRHQIAAFGPVLKHGSPPHEQRNVFDGTRWLGDDPSSGFLVRCCGCVQLRFIIKLLRLMGHKEFQKWGFWIRQLADGTEVWTLESSIRNWRPDQQVSSTLQCEWKHTSSVQMQRNRRLAFSS